jgi:hypothetical protein
MHDAMFRFSCLGLQTPRVLHSSSRCLVVDARALLLSDSSTPTTSPTPSPQLEAPQLDTPPEKDGLLGEVRVGER